MMDCQVKEQVENMTAPMLCVVICGPTLSEAREQVRKGVARGADVLEFRLDLFQFNQIEAIQHLKEAASIPVIFTLRKRSQGGEFSSDEQARCDRIKELATLKPQYFDLEYDLDIDFFELIKEISPETEIISSYHDFEQTPKDLQAIFDVMNQQPIAIYKFATMANSTLDAMRMLRFVRDTVKKGYRIAGVCMGEYGMPTRLLGPVFGNSISFSTLSDDLKTAPGQLMAEELLNRYHFRRLNRETAIYGLIGDPVNKSPSHHTHNFVFGEMGINAIYAKFRIMPEELHEFLDKAKKLDFKGLSVTMPLKECVIKELSSLSDDAQNIRAINTLHINNRNIEGFNTDGIGAVKAIQERFKLKGKKVIILGAGGVSKAIAHEVRRHEAEIVILNRTLEKAQQLAQSVGGRYGTLNDFGLYADEGYDVLINGTSVGLYAGKGKPPIDCAKLLVNKIVLDVIPGPEKTPFIIEAENRHCTVITGHEMLMRQALEQFFLWFGESVDKGKLTAAFEEAFSRFC